MTTQKSTHIIVGKRHRLSDGRFLEVGDAYTPSKKELKAFPFRFRVNVAAVAERQSGNLDGLTVTEIIKAVEAGGVTPAEAREHELSQDSPRVTLIDFLDKMEGG